jgi:predicted SpoU family rRNA methylase
MSIAIISLITDVIEPIVFMIKGNSKVEHIIYEGIDWNVENTIIL